MKEIRYIFFDAEGTLYIPQPRKTTREFWEYGERTIERAKGFFTLDDGVRDSLEELKTRGYNLYVLSRHKKTLLEDMLRHFNIRHLFDDILVNGDKGVRIRECLSEIMANTEEALMIGDIPSLDVDPVNRVGVRCLLIDRKYNQASSCERISGIKELISRLE